MTLLRVEGLGVDLGGTSVVEDVSFALGGGERAGLIGESGSGKSVTALALMGLLPPGMVARGRVALSGEDLLAASERRLSELRGDRIAMVFQEPMTALNPLMRVGRQVAEVLRIHRGMSRRQAAGEVLGLMRRVELPDPERMARAYPHELSGGQRQRVVVAMAVACRPAVVLADEPTTALDVTVQAQVLSLLRRLAEEDGAALVLISHDLAVVSGLCEMLMVMYGGRIVETGPTGEVLASPRHPYTQGLVATSAAVSAGLWATPSGGAGWAAAGDLPAIAGTVPELGAFPSGCRFRDRCERSGDACLDVPALAGRWHRVACWHPVGEDEAVGGRPS